MMKQNIKKNQHLVSLIFLLSAAIFILLPQIYTKSISIGSDIGFHYNRFYEIMMQITDKNFNYYQSLYGFEGSGRIVNALYGYDLAFLHGVLLYITKSWLKFQLISSFLCLSVAGVSAYVLGIKSNLTVTFSTMVGIIYMSSASVMYYVSTEGFSGWGAALLPLIFIPAVRAVMNEKEPINPLYFALAVSVLLNAHLLTALIGVIAIIPFFLTSFVQTKNKIKWLVNAILSVLLTILFSLNTLISYLEVSSSNNLLRPFIPSFFMKESLKLNLLSGNSNKNLGLVFTCMFVFSLVYVIINWKELKTLDRTVALTGGIFLLVSSTLFPWDILVEKFPVLTMLQFPFRLSVVSYVLLTVLFMKIIQNSLNNFQLNRQKIGLSFIITVTCLILFSAHLIMVEHAFNWEKNPLGSGNNSLYIKDTEDPALTVRNNFRNKDLSLALETIKKGTSDYLPLNREIELRDSEDFESLETYRLYREQVIENQKGITRTILDDGTIELKWTTEKRREMLLPIIVYGDSVVTFNDQLVPSDQIKTSLIGALMLDSPEGENKLVVGYQPIFNIKTILIIKIGSLFLAFLWIIVSRIVYSRKKRDKQLVNSI